MFVTIIQGLALISTVGLLFIGGYAIMDAMTTKTIREVYDELTKNSNPRH